MEDAAHSLFLVRFSHCHPSFRRPELQALAALNGLDLHFVHYADSSPFAVVHLPGVSAARLLVSRAILVKSIYELWASAADYTALHAAVASDSAHLWPCYIESSFKFSLDSFQGSPSPEYQRQVFESFSYLGFRGPIRMRNPDHEFAVLEEYELPQSQRPSRLYFGRRVAWGSRADATTYSLKKRQYISTTTMDAEMALLTANMALAAPGKLVHDPFVGTGSLTLACAHFGALVLGSDIDGRAIRGKFERASSDSTHVSNDENHSGRRRQNGTSRNFTQYGLASRYLDAFIGDLTHSPLRPSAAGTLDAIICDPPYGVREGLKVLGRRDGTRKEVVWIEGVAAHSLDTYIAPKRPYGFDAILVDLLAFAADMLVEDGRLSFWMPTANDEDEELEVPEHPSLELVSLSTQPFNKWSRRLLTYRHKRAKEIEQKTSHITVNATANTSAVGRADDLNSFRKRYFEGFRSAPVSNK